MTRSKDKPSHEHRYGVIPRSRGEHLGAVRDDAQANLQAAIDTILIHNEQEVRGNQPRTVLNQTSVLLAIAAWERLIVDLHFLSAGLNWQGPELDKGPKGMAWLRQGEELRTAHRVIAGASDGRLPQNWRVRAWDRYRGKTPTHSKTLHGSQPEDVAEIADLTGRWIELRHGVAHRAINAKGQLAREAHGDAAAMTIQAGASRQAVALAVQLVDQTLTAVITASLGEEIAWDWQLPQWWFDAEPSAGRRGMQRPGVLWDGKPLPRSPLLAA